MLQFNDWSEAFDYCREGDVPATVLIIGKKFKLFPSGQAKDLDPTLSIVFGFDLSGPGTTLTHAARISLIREGVGGSRTLCGITVPNEWYGDDDWDDGPECKQCRKVLIS